MVHTFHLFNWYVFIMLTKTRTETKTVPSTWYIFSVQAYTHTDFHMCHTLSLAYTRNRPHKHTRTNKKDTVCLMTSAHPTFSPHNIFFQFPSRRMHKFSYHTTVQKLKRIYYKSLESSHKLNSTVPIFSKSKKQAKLSVSMWLFLQVAIMYQRNYVMHLDG